MLSRVAERMYWFGRYIERAENTARLIRVNTSLVMDLPDAKHIWAGTIDITGNLAEFEKRFSRVDERNVVKFLLEDESGSIRSSIKLARENARTTREIMPTEVWESVNELHFFIRDNIDKGLKREGRHTFLSEIIALCNQLTGMLAGSMSDDTAYQFLKLGRHLERADMTTRIVDVGCMNLVTLAEQQNEYDSILWMNVLRSLTAYQMYRQHVQDRVNGEDVVDFLLRNRQFPRAVSHCLEQVQKACNGLPRNEAPIRAIASVQRLMDSSDVIDLLNSARLHDFIDTLQLDLATIHQELGYCWFGHEAADRLTADGVIDAA
ncbi:MAG: alpha-E domain-containing protein [Pseudomonadales bacterium]|nr:alpha-E domain-containing protein [Pseudomonadales bacterium]